MRSLVVITQWISDFELDISLDKDIKECSIFETELLGVTTKHFYPKPGYLAKGVKDGDESLWKAQPHYSRNGRIKLFDGYDSCSSCVLYKNGNVELLELTVVKNASSRWYECFEKNGEEWKDLTRNDFFNKLNEMSKSE